MSTLRRRDIPPPPDPQRSLAEEIGHFQINQEGEIFFDMVKDISEQEIDAHGFRHLAPSTQMRQDFHLGQYRAFTRMFKRFPATMSDDATDNHAFPVEQSLLLVNLRHFLLFTFQRAKPRVRKSGYKEYIDYRTLTQYRDSMLFWVKRIYGDRNMEPPTQAKLFNKMTEAMRYCQSTFGSQKVRERRAGLSLDEIRQLIDHDMATANSVEVSEQMQLAWNIGRQTSVRPGAIGTSATRKLQFLQWKDIDITNQGGGRFQALIRFRHLKTNYVDPEKQAEGHRVLECYIDSPNPENITFSVPHRLLTIALRRGLLVGITTIDELLSTDLANIQIKPDHLEDPVFYRAKPRGLGLDMPHPLTSQALSQYLANRGRAIGFTKPITFYSIRRRAASDLVLRIGYEATREIMGHAPDSHTLERYYVDMRSTLDLTGATLNQPVGPGGQSASKAAINAPLALNRLSDERRARIRGAALNAVAEEIMRKDRNYPTEEKDVRNYRRRIRAYAFRVLQEQEAADQKSKMTLAEMKQRKEALTNASQFAQAVISRATEMAENRSSIDINGLEAANQMNFDEEFIADDDAELDAEQDVEEALPLSRNSTDGNLVFHVNTGEEFGPTRFTDTPYAEFARSLMEILLDNKLSLVKTWAERTHDEKVCELCHADDSVDEKTKAKAWANHDALYDHQYSTYHSGFKKWLRRQSKLKNGKGFPCPYCDKRYPQLQNLTRHVKDSTAANTSQEHEDMKDLDGWFEEDFFGMISRKGQRERMKRNLQKLQDSGYEFKVKEPIIPRPHEEWPGVWRGPYEPVGEIPQHMENFIITGDEAKPTIGQIPTLLAHLIHRGSGAKDDPRYEPGYVDPRFRGYIRSGADVKKRKLEQEKEHEEDEQRRRVALSAVTEAAEVAL